MNDENSVFENAEADSLSPHDSLETEIATEKGTCDGEPETEDSYGGIEKALDVLADTRTNPDFDSENPDPQTQEGELEQLRSELKQLREELSLRDARMQQEERIGREFAEFCELYPDVPVSTLPKEIWQDVEKGNSLAAAYALAEKKKAIALKSAGESNVSNRARSSGAIHNAENFEFSPAEVRAMTSEEVRANLPKIMRSMQKWH